MKKFIFTISVFIISVPLMAQSAQSGAGMPTSSVTGAPILEPANTSAVPPTLDRTSPVSSTGAETAGSGSGTFSFDTPMTGTNQGTGTASQGVGIGTSTGFGTGTSTELGTGSNIGSPSATPTQALPPATGTTQPSGSIMTPSNAPMGSGWQGR